MEEKSVGGYSVVYGKDEIYFPVYVLAFVAAACLAGAWVTGQTLWLVFGLAAAGLTYYNFPLLEQRAILGGNQYGIFVQGFGVIRWSAISGLELVRLPSRAVTFHVLDIMLKVPLRNALVSDWRDQPFHRSLMRMQWTMPQHNIVRVKLEPFDQEPEDIHATLMRMWRHYRS